ncbi:hypothetical protein BGZ80_006493 [Entomortierella chlamydospora]|uniref:Uncharacterized protein n=1 Tax=Entomortierella chlamydospora TaxID=101097 RepID=A0A9P6MYW4_9FUNG|nr:hypothetical protein BGZ80_006493 [Entomortierella chlamydospora]
MAFSGTGHRLGDGEWDATGTGTTLAPGVGAVPTLKDICLSTLDRYIDLLEDIGSTPYYLIESVLRKCNVKQLTRVELHTELFERNGRIMTEAGYGGRNTMYDIDHWDFLSMKQEDEDKLARKRELLRQSYSQHDKFKQDRRVIMDPNLRLPNRMRTSSSSNSWPSTAPKKKSLFEKARIEARKVAQMYSSNPYPPPRSRTNSSNNDGIHARTSSGRLMASESGTSSTSSNARRVLAPTRPSASHNTHIPLGSAASRNDSALAARDAVVNGLSLPAQLSTSTMASRGKRYSYKSRPVVYTPLSRSMPAQSPENSTSPTSTSPMSTRAPAGHKLITPSAPGAIVNFFKEINPAHSHATASYRNQDEESSRSPSSPIHQPSKTIQMLREDAGTTTRYHQPSDQLPRKRGDKGKLIVDTKNKSDFRWLEEDDDDEINDHGKTEKFPHKSPANKTPLSLEEAGRQFFNQLIGK